MFSDAEGTTHSQIYKKACVGDGGNDVSMIQVADAGKNLSFPNCPGTNYPNAILLSAGIFGKEGKRVSLAADFSVTQFSFLTKRLLWHDRNSYRRSAKLAQFVIHRSVFLGLGSRCQ